ncbi:MAG: response regulator [Defluviitaleaceae bacterium]|nr:response regulator [Defluviitaleaceae bacterium]
MDNEKPMSIVLVEDDPSACQGFVDCANNRTDIVFVGITDSSDVGLEYVRTKLPEAVILDMELNRGEGSGLEFLERFQKTELSLRPIIVVTTRNRSDLVHEQLHDEHNIEWVFCKLQKGYSPEMVVNHLLKLRAYLHNRKDGEYSANLRTLESPEKFKKRIMQRIDAELNDFGISSRYKGRKMAEDAIFLLITRDTKDSDSLYHELAKIHKTSYNNIPRNIKTAIEDAWQNHDDIDKLFKIYTAPVRRDIGSPLPTEFIHYYAEKIRRSI